MMLKVNLLLVLLYGFYRLLFVRDTFFGLRRATLLAMLAAAFVLPLVDIGWWVEEHRSTVNLVEAYQEVMLPTVVVTGDVERFPWMRLFTSAYIIGVVVLSVRVLVQLLAIFRLVVVAERREVMGSSVCVLTDDTSPFSFFGWIFVNPDKHSAEQLEEIMIHEQTHARQWHSVDIVLMEFCAIVCWWNPFVWLMRREVRLNLEYLADDRVVSAGSERKTYQYHLLGLAYGKNVATISNNFNVLPLKLRIKMMNKKRTNRMGRTKYLLVPALAAALLVASNIESVARTWVRQMNEAPVLTEAAEVAGYALDDNGVTADGVQAAELTAENAAEEQLLTAPEEAVEPEQGPLMPDDDNVFDVVEQMPSFPGGMEAMMDFLRNNVKYPEGAYKQGIQGRVLVQFVVDKTGKVRDAKVVRNVDELLDAEALRVIQAMPQWIPGKQNGKVVNVKYTIPLSFRLSAKEEKPTEFNATLKYDEQKSE